MKKIGIIGGGISGLAVAFLLKNRSFDVTLFEASERAGGNIQSVRIDGFLIEYAANSLLKSPRLVDLIRELKLDTEILAANPNNKKRYVLQNGKLRALPMSVAKMATNDFFSLKAKLRLLKEPFIRTKATAAETVAGFFERRLGREIVEKAADPFISGIYAGNPEKLSIKAAFPRLYELEREYGSLFIGLLLSKAEKADENFPRTFTFKNGVQSLIGKLVENLGEAVKINTKISRIEKREAGRLAVLTERGPEAAAEERQTGNRTTSREEEFLFDDLIIAAPAARAARLIENLDVNLSRQLKDIYYAPVAVVFFGLKKEHIGHDLDGFGFLIPGSEGRKILGTIWNSAVFENRAPAGYDLLTTFVGGSRNEEMLEQTDAELVEIVYEELKSILGLRAKAEFVHIKRWPKAIPQYAPGYEKIENGIEDFENKNKGIFFCSNFYKGISVGDCVKNAYKTVGVIEEKWKAEGAK